MNIQSVNAFGNVSATYPGNNAKSNPMALNKCEYDSYTPSFKGAEKYLTKNRGNLTSLKSLAFVLLFGALALFGCKKSQIINGGSGKPDICGCIPLDYYFIEDNFKNQLKDDYFGQTAFDEWYEENFEGEYVEGCCGGLLPYDLGDWWQKCQDWIDNYLAGNDMCED